MNPPRISAIFPFHARPSSSPKFTLYTEAVGAGIGRYTYELAQALVQTGADVHLLAPHLHWELVAPLNGARRTLLPTPRGARRPQKIASLIYRAIRGSIEAAEFGRQEPIVFSHLVGVPPFSVLGLIGAKLSGARCALLLHDFYPHKFRFPGPVQFVERMIYRWAYRRFDVVFALTETQLPRLLAIGVSPRSIARLPHGVFPLSGVVPFAQETPLRLLVFGSLRRNKGIKETIQAVQELRADGISIELLIAGAPPREEGSYWAECLDVILSAPDGVEVVDRYIEEGDLPSILSSVHAFVCPYRDFDSQSGVGMLALSNGVPLIATPAVGVPVDIVDACQMIEASADTQHIVSAVREFLNHGLPAMQARAADARDRVLRDRSWMAIAETLTTVLREAAFFYEGDQARYTRRGGT